MTSLENMTTAVFFPTSLPFSSLYLFSLIFALTCWYEILAYEPKQSSPVMDQKLKTILGHPCYQCHLGPCPPQRFLLILLCCCDPLYVLSIVRLQVSGLRMYGIHLKQWSAWMSTGWLVLVLTHGLCCWISNYLQPHPCQFLFLDTGLLVGCSIKSQILHALSSLIGIDWRGVTKFLLHMYTK